MWRQFAVRLAAVLLTVAVTFALVASLAMAVVRSQNNQIADQATEIRALREQVDVGRRQQECRSRIVAWTDGITAARDTAQSQFVIATQRRAESQKAANEAGDPVRRSALLAEAAGQLDNASRAVTEIERQNRLLEPALAVRTRAVETCAENPDYTPPT